jgi:uncharacterized protein YprB with RNaseH-like and TPR domain
MASISDKLKALGVNKGAQEISPPKEKTHFPIDEILEGRIIETAVGDTFVAETFYPVHTSHGHKSLNFTASMRRLALWLHEPDLMSIDSSSYVFLDTETSGLAGGTGTYVFLVGIGKYVPGGFRLSQYFLREPVEEKAHLAAILGGLGDGKALVTYNGKAFDAPLMDTRFLLHDEIPPMRSFAHVDLLPIARRLWRDRLPSRRLGSVESNILMVARTGEDIPGWMIPSMYFDYLRSGDARPLRQVFYHNAMDVLSLAALLNHVSEMLDNPMGEAVQFGVELIAIGKVFEDLGNCDEAAACYAAGLADDLPQPLRSEARQRWSLMEKRRKNIITSIELWQDAAMNQEIYAFIELAKIYEHSLQDLAQAIHWTESALSIIQAPDFEGFERNLWLPQLEHRLNRLRRKAG